MKSDLKEFLTRSASRGSPALGKPSLVSLLSDSDHSSARILTVKVRALENEVFVLKQVKTLRSPIFGKYLLKDGEKCPEMIAGHNKALVLDITDEDPKEVLKYEMKKAERLARMKKEKEEKEKEKEKEKTKEKEKDAKPRKELTVTVKRRTDKEEKDKAPKGYSHVTLPLEFCSQALSTPCDGAEILLESSEFLVEASVDYLIKCHMKDKIQFFLTSADTWRSKRHGNILLKNAGFDMNFHFSFYNTIQIQAIVLQTMYAIAWAQKYIHLKHHDLHCGNVFVDGNTKETQLLKFPDGKTFTLPLNMPKILIADYGLSSATDPSTRSRVSRADFHLMETSRSGSSSSSNYDDKDQDEECCTHSGPCRSRSNSNSPNQKDERDKKRRYSSRSSSKSSRSKYSSKSDKSDESDYSDEGSSIEIPQSLLETGSVSSESETKNEKDERDEEMDENDSEDEDNDWGEWNHELNPNNSKRHLGYDIACFVSNLQEEAEDRRHESLSWLNSVLTEMKRLDSEFYLTRRGRPLTSTKFSIEQLARKIKFNSMFLNAEEPKNKLVKKSVATKTKTKIQTQIQAKQSTSA